MVQLSKKVEYSLIALRQMAMKPKGHVFTAKELATYDALPYDLLAKVLQKLTRAGIVTSQQGSHGGYALLRHPEELTIAEVIRAIDDSKPMVAECYMAGKERCTLIDNCTIRGPLEKLQHNLDGLFDNTTLQEII
ncbi:MAG: Rrf2 family transcriptional regulator [bacterium]